jgi:hypothetical protein
MTAQIILFPRTQGPLSQPTFGEWMKDRFAPRRWAVVKVRRWGGKFNHQPDRYVLLLRREYRALEEAYYRETGLRPHEIVRDWKTGLTVRIPQ